MDTSVQNFLAGLVSGVAGVVAGQPLDTLRIRFQQRGNTSSSVYELWRKMSHGEGPKAVFKGMSYPLVTSAVQTAVTFHEYERMLRILHAAGDNASHPPSMLDICTAGLWAGAVQSVLVIPVDVLKIRLQLQQANPGSAHYKGPVQLLKNIITKEGLPGLFRGTTITLIRDTPSYAVYFCTYQWCCDMSHQWTSIGLQARMAAAAAALPSSAAAACLAEATAPQVVSTGSCGDSVTPMVTFFAGGVAGITSWLSVYPFDVIKSRMQAQPRNKSPYRSWLHCGWMSLREEGPAVFTRGLGTTLGRAFLVNASLFATYQACMEGLRDISKQMAAV